MKPLSQKESIEIDIVGEGPGGDRRQLHLSLRFPTLGSLRVNVTSSSVYHMRCFSDAAGRLQECALDAATKGNCYINSCLRLNEVMELSNVMELRQKTDNPERLKRYDKKKMSTLDVARAELGLAVLYLNKAEARDKICRAIQYGSKYLSNREPGTAQNVDKSTSLARKVFRLFKFVNDLHALISPTSPGTPLPLVLLGKDRISLYCWMEPNIRNLPRPEEPTESSNVGRVFGNRVGASSSWMPSLTRISSAKYGSEVQDTQNALQIYQCHEVRIGGVLQYRIALCISLKPWMFTCGSVLTLVPKSIRALLYMMQCKCGRAHWKSDIRPTCSLQEIHLFISIHGSEAFVFGVSQAIGALLKQCAKMVCKGLETDDNNDVLCGRGGSCSTSELNKYERSNDMFCDDIFGESPAGVRKTR
ncbi:unnamed protein product [Camellia sinensis]